MSQVPTSSAFLVRLLTLTYGEWETKSKTQNQSIKSIEIIKRYYHIANKIQRVRN